jgi:hypothetical protein
MDTKERQRIQNFFTVMMDNIIMEDVESPERFQYQLGALGVLCSYYEAFGGYFDEESKNLADKFFHEDLPKCGICSHHKYINIDSLN